MEKELKGDTMTENSKIYLTKNSILNIFAEQKLSIGLSLYIIKDIQQQLQQMYNNIIQKQLSEQKNIQQDNLQEEIDMSDSETYPIKWESSEENDQNTSDQAD